MYRCISKSTVADVVQAMVDRTDECLDHLTKDGKLFLLYDPVPQDDLGVSRVFKYGNERRHISTYKANRKKYDGTAKVIHEYRKLWLYRGPNVISVYSDKHEADDFVESIVSKQSQTIAMVTTDEDWCRYVSDQVYMINGRWDEPFGKNEFILKYGFIPTISSVALNKLFYGDASDNILGILQVKKKGPKVLQNVVNDAIKWVANNNVPWHDVVDTLNAKYTASTMDYVGNDLLSDLACRLSVIDISGVLRDLLTQNVKLLTSTCPDYEPYAHCNPEKPVINSIMNKALRNEPEAKKSFKFGRVTVR
jgi:hypothetical protein